MEDTTQKQPLVGISACLIGQNVRFNGGHARNPYVTDILDKYCTWLPLCPEMGMGMPAPRETLRLVNSTGHVRLIGQKTGTDYTDDLANWTRKTMAHLQASDIHGFIVKKKSPSCGMARLPIYDGKGHAVPHGIGLFTQALMAGFPLLPIEEDGRLFDHKLKEQFLTRLYAYQRLTHFMKAATSKAHLIEFHTRHKLLLQSHHPEKARTLGRLVASIGDHTITGYLQEYATGFMDCLKHGSSRARKAHTLLEIAHHLNLGKDDLSEVKATLKAFKDKELPLAAPLTLIRHHLRHAPEIFTGIHYYLTPYPAAANGPSL